MELRRQAMPVAFFDKLTYLVAALAVLGTPSGYKGEHVSRVETEDSAIKMELIA